MSKQDTETYGSCAGIVLIILIIFIGFLITRTKTDVVTIISRTWSIEQQIEDFQPRNYEGWDETVPSDAYNQTNERRSRGSHEVCSGSGDDKICTRITDYGTWVTYTADRWAYFSAEVNTGTIEDRPTQPEPSTRCTQIEEYGCQRYGQLIENYTITFYRPSDGSEFSCSYSRYDWESYNNSQYQMVFGLLGNEARCGLMGLTNE